MTELDWKPSYSVGIKELDEHHKRLLQLIKEFSNEKPTCNDKRCFVILNELIKYAERHFSAEESLMQQYRYDGLNLQQKEHEAFLDKIFELNKELEDKGAEVFSELVIYLKGWYISHILGTDISYKGFFEGKGVK